MGSTHAVDVLVEINWELAARVLVAGFDPDEALDAALRGAGVVPTRSGSG